MRRRHDLLADKAGADQAGKTDAEDGQRQSGRHLVDRKPERQNAEDPRHRRAGQDAAQRAHEDRTGQVGAAEAAGCADDHHAFDAEVEDAGALDHELAGRRQQQRRRGGDDRQNKADRENQLKDIGRAIQAWAGAAFRTVRTKRMR